MINRKPTADSRALNCPELVQSAVPSMEGNPAACLVICTKDRRAELVEALRTVGAQRGCSLEVIVIDDGSTDGTSEAVSQAFEWVTLYRSSEPRGWSAQRNFAAEVARAPLLVSIDDDARLPDPHTVAQTIADFDAAEDIGAVAIAYRELIPDGSWVDVRPQGGPQVEVVDSFIGTAYAVRRDVFREVGGFWAYDQVEERDFCIRMLEAGHFVRVGTAAPIEHRPSMVRHHGRRASLHRRGDVLFAYKNVPAAHLPRHVARMTVGCVVIATRSSGGRYLLDHLRGYFEGWREAPRIKRRPVTDPVYRITTRLRRSGPMLLEDARRASRRLEIPPGT
jgi:glycosyltransferase involved in cell wall biosynthesis